MPRRPAPLPKETPEDYWLLQEQTARNVEGLQAEQEGRLEEALALYERNVAEGFPGDWPYGRLVAHYERRGALEDAERVLQRGIEVFQASGRRTAQDRRTLVQTFRKRLTLLRRRQVQERKQGR